MSLTQAEADQVADVMQDAGLVAPHKNKDEFRPAVLALDVGLDSVAATLNSSLPTSYRAGVADSHKEILIACVALRRAVKHGIPLSKIRSLLE